MNEKTIKREYGACWPKDKEPIHGKTWPKIDYDSVLGECYSYGIKGLIEIAEGGFKFCDECFESEKKQ